MSRIITQGDLTVAVLEVLDRELTPNLPIAVVFELEVETREPGKCFVDVGLVPQVPKSRWKRLMQRIGLWFLRRAEEWSDGDQLRVQRDDVQGDDGRGRADVRGDAAAGANPDRRELPPRAGHDGLVRR